MSELRERIDKCVAEVRKHWKKTPKVGIILGTGLGSLASSIKKDVEIPFAQLPGMPVATVESHAGKMVLGTLAGQTIAAMEGRIHLYEGRTPLEVTFPVRVLRALGAEILIVSNVAGGMNPFHKIGDVVAIEDHINLTGLNPLIGPNDDTLGPRFPDMYQPYDHKLIELAEKVALESGINLQRGIYVGLTGPCLETRAEYRFLRGIGADVVGMSTVHEVIVAVHAGFRVLGLSVVSDLCLPDALEPASLEKIIKAGQDAEPKLQKIVTGVLAKL